MIEEVKEDKFPTEVIELPSKGYFYSEENPLSSGKVFLRYMTSKHEDILLSKNLVQKGVVIDVLLKELIATKGVNYDEILLGDKNAILFSSRVLAYGNNYLFESECKYCKNFSEHNINLLDLKYKEIDFSKFQKGIREIDFQLPYSKVNVTLKLLNSKDERELNEELKSLKKISMKTGIDSEISTRIRKMICAINGDSSYKTINKFVIEDLLSRDSLAIRNFMNKVSPDIELEILVNCENCYKDNKIFLPISTEFFWPRG